VLGEFASTDRGQVQQVVERARQAQCDWQASPVETRLAVIERFQQLLSTRKSHVARTITLETGKPYVEALLTEILVVLDSTRFLLDRCPAFLRDAAVPHLSLGTKFKAGRLVREPYGVIGVIAPWNYPFSIPAIQTLFALATGNAVVLKPSELAPFSALEISKMLCDAGAPEGLFRLIIGDAATGEALVGSAVQKLVFTGSAATGRKIAERAAGRLLPLVLELGGKDPMIVLDDADLDVASSAAVWGAFLNAGQACLSVERCYVQRSIYAEFISRLADKAKRLRVGSGLDSDTDVGPLIHPRQLRTLEEHVEDARRRGARIVAGGERLPALGANFYAPTVLGEATHEMRIMREETFGPVLPLMAFDSDSEAIRLANDCDYGLAASVWTGNRRRGESLARRIQAGSVMVNDALSSFAIAEAPHGGVKASGIGRTHGWQGLEEMVQTKYVDHDLLPRRKKPWWYPYSKAMAGGAEAYLDFQFGRGTRGRLLGAWRALGFLFRQKL
jgi:succinate-semialdehyde dehydrogenase/glutarate-semialdehyde dehydrogenase